MYEHPAVVENLNRLRNMGLVVVSPRLEEAKAKIPDTETIVEHVLAILGPRDLVGRHFVVTAGPTRGWIDRVRFVSNPSSGKMGVELAREIIARGGTVTLLLGPTHISPPALAETIRVETSEEMLNEVIAALDRSDTDALISAAAILDFTPARRDDRKRPSGEPYAIELVPTKKVIEEARKHNPDLFIVGFKVESGLTDDELVERARAKIDSGVCNLVVANDEQRAGVAFATDTNEVLIVGPSGLVEKVPLSTKREVARRVIDVVAHELEQM